MAEIDRAGKVLARDGDGVVCRVSCVVCRVSCVVRRASEEFAALDMEKIKDEGCNER